VLFNIFIGIVQGAITVLLAAVLLDVPLRAAGWPLLVLGIVIGTAGWFFFYAIFALRIRRNDAFNTVTSVFYFVFLFASSMFYPLDPLPAAFKAIAALNPVTWQVDVLRYATIGVGAPPRIAIEAGAFAVFTVVSFALAVLALRGQE
jgi:ABC-type multidrug transport system permease subunit